MTQYIRRIGEFIGAHQWVMVVVGFLAFMLLVAALPHVEYEAMPPLDPMMWTWI